QIGVRCVHLSLLRGVALPSATPPPAAERAAADAPMRLHAPDPAGTAAKATANQRPDLHHATPFRAGGNRDSFVGKIHPRLKWAPWLLSGPAAPGIRSTSEYRTGEASEGKA